MTYKAFGQTDVKLSNVGLGCMGMSVAYGEKDDAESLATLHRALELGINFWDTADIYGNGANEELLSNLLKTHRDEIFLATKFGFRLRENQGNSFVGADIYLDGSPKYIKEAVEKSLKRLNIDVIDLYYAHRIDPNIPVEETVYAMSELVREGKVRYLGLSECTPSDLVKAHEVHPISALQSEYSLLTRDVEEEILPLTKELGITFVPFAPLSRGLMSNTLDTACLKEGDFRKNLPRYNGEYLSNNQNLAQAFASFAAIKQCTPAQLAIAWVMAQDAHIIPIPGTKRRAYLEENAGATDIVLTPSDLKTIEAIVAAYPNIGPRYSTKENKFLKK